MWGPRRRSGRISPSPETVTDYRDEDVGVLLGGEPRMLFSLPLGSLTTR